MGNLVFQATLGGQVNLVGPNTASTYNINVPALAGTMASMASVTANGVAYVNSSGQPTSGSALVFDGTNLGLGVTPSAWNSVYRSLQLGSTGAVSGRTDSNLLELSSNSYRNSGGGWTYLTTEAAARYDMAGAAHYWYNAASGTAGNAISFTQAMTLDASGNLGVGTTSPTQKITVSGSIRATGNSTNFNETGAQIDAYDGMRLCSYISTGSAIQFLTNASGGNTTERARIDSSGNLLVGKTAQSVTTAGFEIYPDGSCASTRTQSTNGTTTLNVYSTGASAYRFQVGMGGTVYATSTSISAISDQTLKTNVRDLETGLTEVMALKPRRFDWLNGDASNVAGFIAQEVEEVLPELVSDYLYNHDEDGNDIIKKSLKMGDILPTLVKAIQEQQALITQLQADVTALKA